MNLFKTGTKLLFDPEARVDLFKVSPRLYDLFEQQRVHTVWRGFLFILLGCIILVGFYGPQDPARNIILYLCWGLWWPLVILSLFIVGRLWCGVCPFPVVGRFMQKWQLSLQRTVPKVLEKNSIAISIVFFMLIIWVEESTGMKQNPQATAWLLLTIFGGALFCAIIFERQAWCLYFCPLGKVMGMGASISWLEFRPDHSKCSECKTFACKRGVEEKPGCPITLGAFKITNNLECHLCGHCMQFCEHHSPQLNLRHPLYEVIVRKGKFISCTLLVPFLIGSQLARLMDQNIYDIMGMIETACMHEWVCQMGLYVIPLSIGFIIAHMIISYGDLIFGVYHDDLMGTFSPMVPVFLPVAFAGELVSRMNYAIRNVADFIPTMGRQFGWQALENWTFTVPEWIYPVYGISFMFISELAGLYVLRTFVMEDFEGMIPVWRYRILQMVFFALFATYIYLMSTGWDIPYLNVMYFFQ